MDEIYTKQKDGSNEFSEKCPKQKTVDFLKQFARIYSCQAALKPSLGGISLN